MAQARSKGKGEETSRGLGSIVGFFVLTVVAIAFGLGFAWRISQLLSPAPPPPTACNVEDKALLTRASPPPVVMALPSILTNLSGENAPWVRLDLSLVLKEGALELEHVSGQISQEIVAHMRTLDLKRISGATNLEMLRADLEEIARVTSGGAVRGVLVRALLVE